VIDGLPALELETVVETGPEATIEPVPASTTPSSAPQAAATEDEPAALLSADKRRALEDAVFERIRARLDAEMSELLGRQLVPELAARLDAATQALAARLREEIPAAVAQALREHTPPSDD
jgi:hypothetical protein